MAHGVPPVLACTAHVIIGVIINGRRLYRRLAGVALVCLTFLLLFQKLSNRVLHSSRAPYGRSIVRLSSAVGAVSTRSPSLHDAASFHSSRRHWLG